MNRWRVTGFLAAALFVIGHAGCASTRDPSKNQVTVLQPPGVREYSKVVEGGVSVLPTGRYLTPAGVTVRITHDPFGLALSPDGRTALALHDRVLTVIDTNDPQHPVRLPSYDQALPSPLPDSSCMGVAFAPDGKSA